MTFGLPRPAEVEDHGPPGIERKVQHIAELLRVLQAEVALRADDLRAFLLEALENGLDV